MCTGHKENRGWLLGGEGTRLAKFGGPPDVLFFCVPFTSTWGMFLVPKQSPCFILHLVVEVLQYD